MADNAQNQLLPQPDFLVMSQRCRDFADEVAKIPNTPQFDTGNAILDQLRQMNTKFDTAVQQINTRLDTLDTAVRQINTRLDAMNMTAQARDYNNVARVANSLLTASTDTLTALVNPRDNTPIAGFPTTPGDIKLMLVKALSEVLSQLGVEAEGQKTAKEQQLRVFIGLKGSPA